MDSLNKRLPHKKKNNADGSCASIIRNRSEAINEKPEETGCLSEIPHNDTDYGHYSRY